MNKNEKVILAAGIFLITVATIAFFKTVGASTLSLEAPPPETLPLNGTAVTLTGDETDRDINIDPMEPLPMNGTQVITTAGATDMDINEFPPRGVTVMIQNETVTVTRNQVQIIDPTNDLIAVDSGDDSESANGDEE